MVRTALDEIEDWSSIRCAVVTTVSDLELCMETFRALLSRGVAAVSTCEELSWPWLRHPILAQELSELAVRHGGRLLGTGINPGFLMDTLPVVATRAAAAITMALAMASLRVQSQTERRLLSPVRKR